MPIPRSILPTLARALSEASASLRHGERAAAVYTPTPGGYHATIRILPLGAPPEDGHELACVWEPTPAWLCERVLIAALDDIDIASTA